jgi:hypothetical protein
MINTGLINYNKPFTLANGSLTTDAALSTTLQNVKDQLGNSSPLRLATNRIALGSGTISGTSLLNFPDAGTTAADGIQFGIGSSNLYRSGLNTIRTDGSLNVYGTLLLGNGVINASGGNITLNSVANLSAVTGLFSLYPPTLTGSSATSALSISQTWNTTGNPTLIFANVTNTASGASANLIDLQIGGSTIFKVDKNATLTCGAANTAIIHNGTFSLQTAGIQHFRSNSSGTNIGTGGLVASARLSVESTTQGFLPPRMTTAQKNAIASPAAGLMVYDTTLNQMSYYNGTAWVNF